MVAAVLLMILPDMLDAQAGGRHRRTRRRTAVVVHSATKAQDQQAAEAQQQAAADQQQADTVQQAAAPPAPVPAPGEPLPVGTVVPKLPDGCTATPVDNVQYYSCGGNWYRAAYQENNLVYVTTDPPQ
jgi:hypothetical protein